MAQIAGQERSKIFVRCNFELPDCARNGAERPSGRPERSFEAAPGEVLGLIEQAVGRIKQLEGAALRELATTLSRLDAIVARDPGMTMAANDLYEAAAVLVAANKAGAAAVDARHWRMLNDADSRLRARIALAQPNQRAKILR